MTRAQKIQAIVIMLGLGLLPSHCTTRDRAPHAGAPLRLKAALLPYLSFATFFIAQEEGFFAEQGLEVEFFPVGRSDDAIPALAQGDLDVLGAVLSAGVIHAIARGADIRIVADRGHLAAGGCTYSAFMARSDWVESGAHQDPSRLRGRKVAMRRVNFEAYAMEKLLARVGLTLDEIEILDVPESVLSEALAKGTIDLAHTSEPWVSRLGQAGHAVIWRATQQVLPDFQLSLTLFGPSLLRDNPDAGRRFMVAYLKAARQYNAGKTERNLEILAKHTKLDRELLRQMCWVALDSDGRIDVQSVIEFQSWALKRRALDRSVTVDRFWDSSFVRHAAAVLGNESR